MVVVLAGCDAYCKFHMFSSTSAGSTNDVIAWRGSNVYQFIADGYLPSKYFINGDDAFDCTDQVLTPYAGHGLGPWKDSFNYHLSSMRQCIERAFGILTQR